MSTDEMIKQEFETYDDTQPAKKTLVRSPWGTPIPFLQPAQPRQKRVSGIADRLREKKAKVEKWLTVLKFASELHVFNMQPKNLVRSVKLQNGISTREARLAVRQTKPKKHRAR